MSETAAPEKEKRRGGGCLKKLFYFLLMIVGVVIVWLAFNFRPLVRPGQPLLPVSAELTILTEPLDDNGDVDYLEAINQKYSAGVTTENNAMVKFAQALGPQEDALKINAEFCRRLGIAELPEQPTEGNYFVDFNRWQMEKMDREANAAFDLAMGDDFGMGMMEMPEPEIVDPEEEPLDDEAFRLSRLAEDYTVQLRFAQQNPWSPETLPDVEKWLRHNADVFKLVEEGLRRPDYYHPMISLELPKILNAKLVYPDRFRDLSRYLAVRAMLNLYQGDINKSLDDIERMFRFGELAAQGPTLIEELFGIAISSQAKDCALQIAIHNETNVLQLERLQQILAEFTPIGGIANRIDEIERYVALEFATVSGRGKHGVASAQSGNAGQSLREKTAAQIADFEEVVIVLNDQYDKCLEILKASGESVEAREAAMDAFESWMKQLQIGVVDLWAAAKTIAAGRKSKGNWLGRLMSGMLIPSVYQVVKAETRTKSKLEMARLHIAVRRFQKDTGQLPTSLDELTPKYLESLATDPFTDQPFVYTVTEDDFRIHSELWKPPTIGQDGEQEYDLGFQNTEYLLWPRQVTWEEFLKDFEY